MCNERAFRTVLEVTARATGGLCMETAYTGAARRELAFVVFLASAGLALVLLVAFVPWYGAVVSG
jgi:hypothetical protein